MTSSSRSPSPVGRVPTPVPFNPCRSRSPSVDVISTAIEDDDDNEPVSRKRGRSVSPDESEQQRASFPEDRVIRPRLANVRVPIQQRLGGGGARDQDDLHVVAAPNNASRTVVVNKAAGASLAEVADAQQRTNNYARALDRRIYGQGCRVDDLEHRIKDVERRVSSDYKTLARECDDHREAIKHLQEVIKELRHQQQYATGAAAAAYGYYPGPAMLAPPPPAYPPTGYGYVMSPRPSDGKK